MDVDMLIDLDDVTGQDLRAQYLTSRRHEALMEVMPDGRLFEVGVHARKGRRHRKVSMGDGFVDANYTESGACLARPEARLPLFPPRERREIPHDPAG